MREDRLQYLSKNTFLGFCSNRLQDLFIEVSHQDGEIEGYETGEEALDVLEKAIRSGDRLNIVGTIANILIHIQRDLALRDEELPPLPLRYAVPI